MTTEPTSSFYSATATRVDPQPSDESHISDKPQLYSLCRGTLVPITRIDPELNTPLCALWTKAKALAENQGGISLAIDPSKRIERMVSYETSKDGPEIFISCDTPELKDLASKVQEYSRKHHNVSNPEMCVSLLGDRRGAPPFVDSKYWEKYHFKSPFIKSPFDYLTEDHFGKLVATHFPSGEGWEEAFRRNLKSFLVLDTLKEFLKTRDVELEAQSKLPESPENPMSKMEQIANDRYLLLKSQEMTMQKNLDLEPIYFAVTASSNKIPMNEAEEMELADIAEKATIADLTLRVNDAKKKAFIETYGAQVGDTHLSENDRIEKRIKKNPNRDLSAPSIQQLVVQITVHAGNADQIHKIVKGFYGGLSQESEDAMVKKFMDMNFTEINNIDLTTDTTLKSWVEKATPFIKAHNPSPRWIRDRLPSLPFNMWGRQPFKKPTPPPAAPQPPAGQGVATDNAQGADVTHCGNIEMSNTQGNLSFDSKKGEFET